MLSTFASLLAYSIIGATILRLTIGIILLFVAYRTIIAAKTLNKHTGGQTFPIIVGIIEVVVATLLIIGLYTQITAIAVFAVCLFLATTRKHFSATAIESKMFYALLAFSSITLIFFGPGLFAIDLPL